MTFGQGGLNFLVNSPEAVAQNIGTRLRLLTGEWFLDITEGTAWNPLVLGYGTSETRDVELRQRILETEGVTDIESYSSVLSADRKLTVSAIVNTLYGQITLDQVF